MILHGSAGGWDLRDPTGFRAFKVVLSGLAPEKAPPLDGLAFATGPEGVTHAWVSPASLARLAGPVADAAWLSGLAAMIAFAAKHGWVRDDGAVRAHVERDG